jgi:DNA modification methylase
MKTEIHIGDCLEVLRTLPAGSVQTCITSPPYWGLRDYGTAAWVGGDPGCDHEVGRKNSDHQADVGPKDSSGNAFRNSGKYIGQGARSDGSCPKCGAKRSDSQIGLEKTPEDHIAVMVEVFREVRRVLRDDGTLWMNYGDAYMDKQLIGMPWRVALALQADGWWLRSSIIWAKGVSFCDTYSGSVMPESCRDRPTRAHENIFLLSKAPRYFYDADAVREKHAEPERSTGKMEGFDTKGTDGLSRPDFREGGKPRTYNPAGRNLRDVWIINPQGFPGAHFATFPPALVEPCIKAGTSEKGCCSICGAPIRRVVEATGGTIGEAWHDHSDDLGLGQQKDADGMESYSRETTGWEPTCDCEDAGESVPCKVLDPFGGAGTAALVADRLGRDAVLVELNKEYAEMARDRILADCPMFSSVELVGGCKEKTPRNK